LAASSRVAAYDKTFQGLPRDAIRRRARQLAIPSKVEKLLRAPYSIAFVLLGDDYLEACALDDELELGGPTLVFSGPRVGLRLPTLSHLRHVSVGNGEAKRFACAAVGLKGELARRALTRLAARPSDLSALAEPGADVLSWLDAYDIGSRQNGSRAGAPQ
jgi:hypothetical protein